MNTIEAVDITQLGMVLLVPILPLLAFIVTILLKNQHTAAWVATAFSAAILLVVGSLVVTHWGAAGQYLSVPWVNAGGFTFNVGILLDRLSLVMLAVVAFIALLVNVFSLEYMRNDKAKGRYFAYLGLFAFSMYGIVLSSNLFLTFIFWELVGFSSYLLIGFWYQDVDPPKASFKAFVVNRVGDAGFLTGLFVIFVFFKTFELPQLWQEFATFGKPAAQFGISEGWLAVMGIGLFLGAVGKSAQFPLQTWLPDAMAGPTPVSALIHAATMVAAGVFMLVRVFPLLSVPVLDVIALVGGLTAFMGAFAAFAQHDIKKVLAYSTVSQLGYMVMSIGVGSPDAAFFHLVTHAFFKASLFLCAGSIIHHLHHEPDPQDMRGMGGLKKHMPYTFAAFTIAMLALSGLPFFSGYYSKEAILSGTLEWVTYNSIGGIGWKALVPLMAFMSVFMTAAYMGRQYFMVFFGAPRWTVHQHKESWYVAVPVLALAGLSLWFFYGLNPFHAEPFLMQLLHYKGSLGSEHLINATVLGVVSVVLALAGLGTAYCIYGMGKGQKIRQSARQHLGGLSLHHWYMDLIQQKIIVQPAQRLSAALYTIDKRYVDGVVNFIGVFHVVFSQILGWLDKYLVDGVIRAITRLSGTLGHLARSVQNGRVQSYYVWALVGIVLVLIALL